MSKKSLSIKTAIRREWIKAVGEYNWDYIRIPIQHALSGWSRTEDCPNDVNPYDKDLFELSRVKGFFRPKTLARIESNNGWTFIESPEDLPTDRSILYQILKSDGDLIDTFNLERFSLDNVVSMYSSNSITHYKPHIDYLPIY